jgi:hypothetical protein
LYLLGYVLYWAKVGGKEEGMLKDEERPLYKDIKPRQHAVSFTASGRYRYPFKRMIVNDYFLARSMTEAEMARNAVKGFCKRHAGKQFTVRQMRDVDGLWVIRRVA